jgi:amidase
MLNDIMDKHNLDAITGLTMGMSCAIDKIYGDRWGSVFLTQPAAISGFPHLTVPAGQVYGLPVGISFFGKAFTEEKLLSMGYAFEQATMHRALPKFLPYLEG